MFVDGLLKSGKDFTQASVVDAINSFTAFSANGMIPPQNWSNGHGPDPQACTAYVEAVNGKFVPRFGKPGQPLVCFPDNPRPPTLDDPYYLPAKTGTTTTTSAGS